MIYFTSDILFEKDQSNQLSIILVDAIKFEFEK